MYRLILKLLVVLCLEHVQLSTSIEISNRIHNGEYNWPRFYSLGETSPPTQAIYNNLTHYYSEWKKLQESEEFHQTYAFTMAWDCSPSQCNQCLQANKFINVDDSVITSLTTSELNDDSKRMACETDNGSNAIGEYRTIDELYDEVIKFVENGLDDIEHNNNGNKYLIIELMLHRYYLFPIAVKLSQGSNYYAWDISCFEPTHIEQETEVCGFTFESNENEKKYRFWITEETQSFIGWSMLFLIGVACSLGYCINWLKKKKSEKIEAWRQKEEENRHIQEEKEREKENRHNKKSKSKRKSPKVKHRPNLEKGKKQKQKHKHKQKQPNYNEYSGSNNEMDEKHNQQ